MNTIPDPDETPQEVAWSQLGDVEQLDERVSAVTAIFGSVIGMNSGTIEWCPDVPKPTEQERLAWLWVCWPQLSEELLKHTDGELHALIHAYRSDEMEKWWARFST